MLDLPVNPKYPHWKVMLAFFIGGICSGLCYGLITSWPGLEGVWFDKVDKGFWPSWQYWLGSGISFLLCLIGTCIYLRLKGVLLGLESVSVLRRIVAAICIAVSGVTMFGVDNELWTSDAGHWFFLTDPFVLALMLSFSLWFVTARWHMSAALLILLVCLLTRIVANIIIVTFQVDWNRYEIIEFPIGESLLAALSGYWLIRSGSARSEGRHS